MPARRATIFPSPRRRGSGRGSPRSASAGRPGRSRSCTASSSRRSAGSARSGSCTRSTIACCCPGPEAQQLAIYIGWLLHKTKGGLVAGILFVLPGFVAIMALSLALCRARQRRCRRRPFLRPQGGGARDRAGGGAPDRPPGAQEQRRCAAIAAAAFVAIFFFGVPVPADRPRRRARSAIAGARAGVAAFLGGGGHGPGRADGRRRRHRARRRHARSRPARASAGRCASRPSSCCSGWRRSPRCCSHARAGQRVQPDRALLLARWRW